MVLCHSQNLNTLKLHIFLILNQSFIISKLAKIITTFLRQTKQYKTKIVDIAVSSYGSRHLRCLQMF